MSKIIKFHNCKIILIYLICWIIGDDFYFVMIIFNDLFLTIDYLADHSQVCKIMNLVSHGKTLFLYFAGVSKQYKARKSSLPVWPQVTC